jgi:CheY-like chemotaxis protein
MDQNKLHILLCDDSDDDRFFFTQAVSKENDSISLTTVRDGEELMERLYRSQPDLPDVIFLDLNMPRKNGFQCLEEIRNSKEYQKIAVVIFTTTDQEEAVERTYEAEANLYIVKPPNFSELSAVIKKAINLLRENQFHKLPRDKYVINQTVV